MSTAPSATVPAGAVPLQAQPWRPVSSGPGQPQADLLADELPVALVFNGISHAVMMATPLELEDFALGFALSEGLLHSPAELFGLEIKTPDDGLLGLEVHLHVAASAEWRLKERRRTLAGRTGCGLCGTDSLAQVLRPLPPLPTASHQLQVPASALCAAQAALRSHQTLQRLTGATHACAWADLTGQVLLVREDIGRHNALDKLLGALVRAGTDPATGFVCITSRASYEMVQKTLALGIGTLAAVSAPTALAVRMAQTAGQLLCGFVRDDGLVAYSRPERLTPST